MRKMILESSFGAVTYDFLIKCDLKKNDDAFFCLANIDGDDVVRISNKYISYNTGVWWLSEFYKDLILLPRNWSRAKKKLKEKLKFSGYLFITDEQANFI